MSQAVISSNQSIKTKRVTANLSSLGFGTHTILATTENEYVEVYVLTVGGIGTRTWKILDNVTGADVSTSISGAYSYRRVDDELAGGANTPKKLVIPNNCTLYVTGASGSTSVVLVGISFINSP